MRIARKHRLHAMACDLGQVSIVDASGAEMGYIGMAALMRTDVEAGGFPGRHPNVSVEVPLAPHAASGRREQQLAVRAVQIDLGFQHPAERRRDRDDTACSLLAVIGLRALEDRPLVGGAPNLMPVSVKVRTRAS